MTMNAESVHVVRRGEVVDFEEDKCRTSIGSNGRKYLNYEGGRFKFVIRNAAALYGVAKHSKFGPKLSLIIRDPVVIAKLDAVSDRVKAEFGEDEKKVYKPFLLGDEKLWCRKIVIKITDESKCKDGASVQGGVMSDDTCSVIFTTSVYEYGAYRGFSHRLQTVKVVPACQNTEHVL